MSVVMPVAVAATSAPSPALVAPPALGFYSPSAAVQAEQWLHSAVEAEETVAAALAAVEAMYAPAAAKCDGAAQAAVTAVELVDVKFGIRFDVPPGEPITLSFQYNFNDPSRNVKSSRTLPLLTKES